MLDNVLTRQSGIITAPQAHALGLTRDTIRGHLRAGRWSTAFRGVYCTFSGPLPRPALLWAVLLHAGRGATFSHETAAELHGLVDRPPPGSPASPIHVSIPEQRRVAPTAGVVVHRSTRIGRAKAPASRPALRCTSIEDTVLDLTDAARRAESAIGWITTACARRLTTPAQLLATMARRKKVRRRVLLTRVLDDAATGAHSVLERRYLRDVERGHALPRGRRQVRHRQDGKTRYRDVEYTRYGTVVELDGRAYHPEERRRADQLRDNAASAEGRRTLRYGWTDVTAPCRTAAEVGRALRAGGWASRPRRCRRRNCGSPAR